MRFGISKPQLELIVAVLKKHTAILDAKIYGSRGKGTHRPGSDIDICLFGKLVDLTLVNRVSTELDELPTPYTFDLSIYHKIENTELKDHIDRVGLSLV